MENELRERLRENQRRYIKNNPWIRSYTCAYSRCNYKNDRYYGKVKFMMTIDDFKYLWFRDKAFLLKEPSIDRIDNNGHYILSNCRFIEKLENTIKGNLGTHKSETIKRKISKSRLGQKITKEVKNKMRIARIEYWKRRKNGKS